MHELGVTLTYAFHDPPKLNDLLDRPDPAAELDRWWETATTPDSTT